MNTGVQRSGATPPARARRPPRRWAPTRATPSGRARTSPSWPWPTHPLRGHRHRGRPARPRGQGHPGHGDARARYVHILVPCPLGWGSAAGTRCGWPAWRPRRASSRSSRRSTARSCGSTIRRPAPVEEYLRLQGRFRTFRRRGEAGPARVIAALQAMADGRIARYGLLGTEGGRPDREAFRHHPRGRFEPGQQDRLVAHRAAGVRRPPAAVQRRLPGRGEHPAVAVPGRRRLLRGGLAPDHARQPAAAVMGRACFHPCQTACNRATIDEAVGINAIERFLGDRAWPEGWAPDPPGPPPATGSWSSARAPAGSRPPTTCACWATRWWSTTRRRSRAA